MTPHVSGVVQDGTLLPWTQLLHEGGGDISSNGPRCGHVLGLVKLDVDSLFADVWGASSKFHLNVNKFS